jgi:multiple sugar transport system permease protein
VEYRGAQIKIKEFFLRKQSAKILHHTWVYCFLILVGATMILPFIWMLSTSLKDPGDVFNYPPEWIPSPLVLANYVKSWLAVPFARGYLNSIVVAVATTGGQVLTSSLAAYAFARLTFPGRDKLFFAYLATMMIPGDVTMIPVFILLKKLPEYLNMLFSPENQWWLEDMYLFGKFFVGKPIGIDSYFALIAPALFTAYGTFMLRQFFMSIPRDLEDAAKIDGCSLFGIYWRVVMPLSKAAIATLTTFTFMGSWKSFIWPLIVTNSLELKVLPVMLQAFQGSYNTEWTLLMAGNIIMLLPIILVFIFNQRFFVEGIQLGGVKG